MLTAMGEVFTAVLGNVGEVFTAITSSTGVLKDALPLLAIGAGISLVSFCVSGVRKLTWGV